MTHSSHAHFDFAQPIAVEDYQPQRDDQVRIVVEGRWACDTEDDFDFDHEIRTHGITAIPGDKVSIEKIEPELTTFDLPAYVRLFTAIEELPREAYVETLSTIFVDPEDPAAGTLAQFPDGNWSVDLPAEIPGEDLYALARAIVDLLAA